MYGNDVDVICCGCVENEERFSSSKLRLPPLEINSSTRAANTAKNFDLSQKKSQPF